MTRQSAMAVRAAVSVSFDIVDNAPAGSGVDSRVDLRGQQVAVEVRFTDEAWQPGVVADHITVR